MLTTWERVPEQFIEVGYTPTPGPLSSPCWIWNGRTNDSGYGVLGTFRAHRIFYEIANGGIPGDLLIRHQCHVRACVNPVHLLVGDRADNARDARVAGRVLYGERNANAKLSDAQADEIRSLRAAGHLQKRIAARFGVSQSLVSMILRGARRNPDGARRVLRRTPEKKESGK